MSMPDGPGNLELLTYPKAAAELHIHEATLRKWVARGVIANVRHGGRVFIARKAIEDYFRRQLEAGYKRQARRAKLDTQLRRAG